MRRVGIISTLGMGMAVLLLAGCPSSYPKCSSDNDCKAHNEVCVEGMCQECAGDQNCKAGFVCQTHQCVPKPECTTDAQCTGGKKCQAGKCQYQCTASSDCGAGACVQHQCVIGGCNQDADCGSSQSCQQNRCVTAQKASCDWSPVHFEFNEATLTPEAQSRLQGMVDCIEQAKGKVVLEGYADERGTEEYNLELSNRRASSVADYLENLGVPKDKLGAVGYGENRPVDSGHDEAAWAKNRRVAFRHG